MKSKYKILKRIVIFVIIVQVVMFTVVIVKQTAGRPHFAGKAFMAPAVVLNEFYIYPLSKVFGPYNALTVPLYKIRDALYNKGWGLLPANDAEREMWWFAIRWKEFQKFIMPDLAKAAEGKNQFELKIFENWTNELYQHMSPLAQKPLKDNRFKEKRLEVFNRTAYWYTTCRMALINEVDKHKHNYPFVINEIEIDRIKRVLQMFLNLKEYSAVNESSAYSQMTGRIAKSWFLDPYFINKATLLIIGNEIVNNKVCCDCEYTKMHLETRNILLKAVVSDPTLISRTKQNINSRLRRGLYSEVINAINNTCSLDKG